MRQPKFKVGDRVKFSHPTSDEIVYQVYRILQLDDRFTDNICYRIFAENGRNAFPPERMLEKVE